MDYALDWSCCVLFRFVFAASTGLDLRTTTTPIRPSGASEAASSSASARFVKTIDVAISSTSLPTFLYICELLIIRFFVLLQDKDKEKEKEKEKSGKVKQPHQFVPVCHSNSQPCDVCSKSLTNKAALRCESKPASPFVVFFLSSSSTAAPFMLKLGLSRNGLSLLIDFCSSFFFATSFLPVLPPFNSILPLIESIQF